MAHRWAEEAKREYIDMYVRAEKWSGEIQNMEPEKCDELAWYDLDNLPENMVPEVKSALEHIEKGVHYSEIHWPTA